MKSLPIYSDTFNALIDDFRQDLSTWNYSDSTKLYMPIHIQEFFHYLEAKGYRNLEHVTTKMVTDYYENHLSNRKNARRGGGLSGGSLNKHQQALSLFRDYFKKTTGKIPFGVHLKYEKANTIDVKDILSIDEVMELFEACNYSHTSKAIRLRDKAILTVLYSCGLRRNEAVGIDISDIDFEKSSIYISKGIGNKRRQTPYVPIGADSTEILKDYVHESRPLTRHANETDALFLNHHGTRLQGQSMANRLKAIIQATGNPELIAKNITPHNLRHSIATHLLQNGMPIEEVKVFLGHASLESTQIYTHIIEQLESDEV